MAGSLLLKRANLKTKNLIKLNLMCSEGITVKNSLNKYADFLNILLAFCLAGSTPLHIAKETCGGEEVLCDTAF